ncbi:methyl-accepting chemotaxis protein [Calidithermus roseus]|uniref:Methyl-accepting chemotaxis protein 4 n=1 Tax=Calidithermus roseus TaxID=1644118 RepID=A0A399EWN1_9DEIN|nr:methyl-accepting chemotaxis protein [Calidithermus roseus]RIH86932.1 Methyl-accepting chemotaxis protein 4 [Calidithermus roseus]
MQAAKHKPKPNPRPAASSASPRIRFGIRQRILLLLALPLLSLLAAASIATAVTLQQSLEAEFSAKGEAIARSIASSIDDDILAGNQSAVQQRLEDFSPIPNVTYIFVLDNTGQVFGSVIAHVTLKGGSIRSTYMPQAVIDSARSSTAVMRRVNYTDAVGKNYRDILEHQAPIVGNLGRVFVGIDRSVIVQKANQIALALALGFALVAVVVLLLATVLLNRLFRPVNRLVSIATRIGQGDLSETTDVKTNDELGMLGRTLDQSIVQLRGLVRTAEERDRERREREQLQANIAEFLKVAMDIAQGDLTKRGAVTQDVLGSVVDAVNLATEEIARLLQDVQQTALQVNQGARSMASTSAHVLEAAASQAEEALKARGQTRQVAQTVQSLAQTASSSAEASQQTLQAARAGEQAVEATLAGMRQIREQMQGIAESIRGLASRSAQISEVADALADFASQTNLLALNATFEAAGAGELGRRFAVVAEEIRKLAEDSAKATRQVSDIVTDVQQEIGRTVSAVLEGAQTVEVQYRSAEQAQGQLREIARLAEQSSRLAALISSYAQSQVKSIELVDEAVQSIAQTAQSTQSESQQGRQAAEELRRLAEQLSANLSRFRLA